VNSAWLRKRRCRLARLHREITAILRRTDVRAQIEVSNAISLARGGRGAWLNSLLCPR